MATDELGVKKHVKFIRMHLNCFPQPYTSVASSRMTLLYFSLAGLHTLGKLEETVTFEERKQMIEWVYASQVKSADTDDYAKKCGFMGSPAPKLTNKKYTEGHLAMTYTALCSLRLLGDDFSRVDKEAILNSLQFLQCDDGSFKAAVSGSENDTRFLYCACCICWLLGDQQCSRFDVAKAVAYVVSCRSYDGGIGLSQGKEGHGGSVYTAVASLAMMDQLHSFPFTQSLIRWCVMNQVGGFRGRPNKQPDTCYSFWIGAALSILNSYQFTHTASNRQFNFSCIGSYGGFAKVPDANADIAHTCHCLFGLSLMSSLLLCCCCFICCDQNKTKR